MQLENGGDERYVSWIELPRHYRRVYGAASSAAASRAFVEDFDPSTATRMFLNTVDLPSSTVRA